MRRYQLLYNRLLVNYKDDLIALSKHSLSTNAFACETRAQMNIKGKPCQPVDPGEDKFSMDWLLNSMRRAQYLIENVVPPQLAEWAQKSNGKGTLCSLSDIKHHNLCSSLLTILPKQTNKQTKVMLGPLKGVERIFQKTHEDNGGDFSRILDLCRSSITFSNPKDLLKCLEIMIADSKAPLLKVGGKITPALLADPIQHNGRDLIAIERIKARLAPEWPAVESGGYRDVLM